MWSPRLIIFYPSVNYLESVPNSLRLEQRQLKTMLLLKKQGGHFTSAEEVDHFMQDPACDEKAQKDRLRVELTYARNTSASLPRTNALFRIYVAENGKRRLRTPIEFATALQKFLGKASNQESASVLDFKLALKNSD